MALLKKKEAAPAASAPEKPVNDAPSAPVARPKFSSAPKAKLGVAGVSLLISAICLFAAVFFQLVSLKTFFFF